MEASELECCLTVENLNSNGVVTKRRTFKSITVVLGRDEFGDIVSSQSLLGKTFLLKELTIHKRFLREGKATIKPLTQKIRLMFRNCSPNQLATFLKCLSWKLAQSKQNGIASNRRRLLSDKTQSFENISPLTDKDFTVAARKDLCKIRTVWHRSYLKLQVKKAIRIVETTNTVDRQEDVSALWVLFKWILYLNKWQW